MVEIKLISGETGTVTKDDPTGVAYAPPTNETSGNHPEDPFFNLSFAAPVTDGIILR